MRISEKGGNQVIEEAKEAPQLREAVAAVAAQPSTIDELRAQAKIAAQVAEDTGIAARKAADKLPPVESELDELQAQMLRVDPEAQDAQERLVALVQARDATSVRHALLEKLAQERHAEHNAAKLRRQAADQAVLEAERDALAARKPEDEAAIENLLCTAARRAETLMRRDQASARASNRSGTPLQMHGGLEALAERPPCICNGVPDRFDALAEA